MAYDPSAAKKGTVRAHCRKTKTGKGKCLGSAGRTTQAKNTTGKTKVKAHATRKMKGIRG